MAVVLALAAAFLFALGTVLQQRVAVEATDEEAGGAGFLLRLARQPRWLAGIAVDGLGFVCQAIALAVGRLVVVQPLLAASVVFALPLGATLTDQRVTRRDVMAAVAVTGGLAVFLLVSNPSAGVDDATTRAWIVSGAIVGTLCAGLLLAARGRPPALRAALLGTGAGILFGLSAALTKATVEVVEDDGLFAVFGDWHVYALIVVGYASMSFSQISLQTGALPAAVSTQMALDPVSSLVLGIFAFDERLHETPLGVVGSLAGIAAMLVGLVVLAAAQQGGGVDRAAAPRDRRGTGQAGCAG